MGTQLPSQPRAGERVKYSVLVVDDDANFLTSVTNLLSDDADVTSATSAERALHLLRGRSFHVVISDFAMPGMNGSALLTHIGRLPEYVSCLLMTGSDRYQPLASEARHYVLFKPFDPERLLRMVKELGRVAEMKRSVKAMSDLISESRIKNG
jgi:DNA-binding NtrC family response regulator